jgi:hypothetical protein
VTDLNLPDVRGESASTRRNFAALKRWVEAYVAAASGGDHGALTGLTDDDHPQYHNDARGDARYSALGHTHAGVYEAVGVAAALVDDLSGVSNAATARTNLGLGSLAMLSAVSSADIVDGTIVNADINAAAAIADTKLATVSTANKVALSAVDLDGATEIGAALVDADVFFVDDGAAGTNRKSLMSRLATYIFGKVSGGATITSAGVLSVAAGHITTARLSTTTGNIAGTWTTYTPTFTNVTGGAATARYMRVGKTLHFRVDFTAGTATAAGAVTASFGPAANSAAVAQLALGLNTTQVVTVIVSASTQFATIYASDNAANFGAGAALSGVLVQGTIELA